jgi:hypothetical protein
MKCTQIKVSVESWSERTISERLRWWFLIGELLHEVVTG